MCQICIVEAFKLGNNKCIVGKSRFRRPCFLEGPSTMGSTPFIVTHSGSVDWATILSLSTCYSPFPSARESARYKQKSEEERRSEARARARDHLNIFLEALRAEGESFIEHYENVACGDGNQADGRNPRPGMPSPPLAAHRHSHHTAKQDSSAPLPTVPSISANLPKLSLNTALLAPTRCNPSPLCSPPPLSTALSFKREVSGASVNASADLSESAFWLEEEVGGNTPLCRSFDSDEEDGRAETKGEDLSRDNDLTAYPFLSIRVGVPGSARRSMPSYAQMGAISAPSTAEIVKSEDLTRDGLSSGDLQNLDSYSPNEQSGAAEDFETAYGIPLGYFERAGLTITPLADSHTPEPTAGNGWVHSRSGVLASPMRVVKGDDRRQGGGTPSSLQSRPIPIPRKPTTYIRPAATPTSPWVDAQSIANFF
jgi:hypothetical protein